MKLIYTAFVCLLLAHVCGTMPAQAASSEVVLQLVQAVDDHPEKTVRDSRHILSLNRKDANLGPMELQVVRKDGRTYFGIQALVIVGAKESNYDLDTPCVGQFTDADAQGKVSALQWQCIAWTPTMEQFVTDHQQEVYDKLVEEAHVLLNLN